MVNKNKVKKKKGVVVNNDRIKYKFLTRAGGDEKVLGIDFYNSLTSLLLKLKKDKRRLDLRSNWGGEEYLLYIEFKKHFDNYEKINDKLIMMVIGSDYNQYYLKYLDIWDIPISMLGKLSIRNKYDGDATEVKELKESLYKTVDELEVLLLNLKERINT